MPTGQRRTSKRITEVCKRNLQPEEKDDSLSPSRKLRILMDKTEIDSPSAKGNQRSRTGSTKKFPSNASLDTNNRPSGRSVTQSREKRKARLTEDEKVEFEDGESKKKRSSDGKKQFDDKDKCKKEQFKVQTKKSPVANKRIKSGRTSVSVQSGVLKSSDGENQPEEDMSKESRKRKSSRKSKERAARERSKASNKSCGESQLTNSSTDAVMAALLLGEGAESLRASAVGNRVMNETESASSEEDWQNVKAEKSAINPANIRPQRKTRGKLAKVEPEAPPRKRMRVTKKKPNYREAADSAQSDLSGDDKSWSSEDVIEKRPIQKKTCKPAIPRVKLEKLKEHAKKLEVHSNARSKSVDAAKKTKGKLAKTETSVESPDLKLSPKKLKKTSVSKKLQPSKTKPSKPAWKLPADAITAALMYGEASATTSKLSVEGMNSSAPLVEEMSTDDSDADNDQWEEVGETAHNTPKKPIQVTVERTDKDGKRKKKFDWAAYAKRLWNRFQKEMHEAVHGVGLMCLLARGMLINKSCNSDLLQSIAISLYPKPTLKGKGCNQQNVAKIITEICASTHSALKSKPFIHRGDIDINNIPEICGSLQQGFPETATHLHVVVLLVSILRYLGASVRLVQSLYPIEFRFSQYIKQKRIEKMARQKQSKSAENLEEAQTSKSKKKAKADPEKLPKTESKEYRELYWIEVYLNVEQKWMTVDSSGHVYESHSDLEGKLQMPIRYIVSYDNDGHLKDITQKYDSAWMISTRKLRTSPEWWEETLKPYHVRKTKKIKQEDEDVLAQQEKMPFPSTIGDFKSHPLYALERHLLKFEALYPRTIVPLGYTKTKEPIYPRECVKSLHSRETWLKEARQIKLGEEPYKMVKPRPKMADIRNKIKITEATLPVFGEWQTEPYIPPVAENGKVPRNGYGNVELFKPEMMPIGCVHIPIQGVGRLCRKLNIDCAPAMMGWETHSGHSVPILDGWIVCKEFKNTIMDAWDEFEAEQEAKAAEKREKKIYGNWKTLIRGLLIRERLRNRYGGDTF